MGFASLFVEKERLGLVDLGRKVGRSAGVGVNLLHEPPMGVADLGLAGAGLDAQDRAGLVVGHGAIAGPAIRCTLLARSGARRFAPGIAPGAVQIGFEHDSGEMSGEVLDGRFAGRRLEELDLGELGELWRECQAVDAQSAAVLEADLERTQGEAWREAATTATFVATPTFRHRRCAQAIDGGATSGDQAGR